MAGYATALAEAKKLQRIVQSYGVKCTIELQVGRPWSGDDWYSKKSVLMNHHTAGPRSGLTPSLGICKRGRSDVPGPLCNGYGGRDKVFRILTMGLANHPGAGGPITVAGVRLPKDSARISSFGIEWEHTGIHPWPADMLEFMGKVGAAVLDYMNRPTTASIEHSSWTTRKIDRNTFSRSGSTGQALINKYRGNPAPPTEDDDMPYSKAEIEQMVRNGVAGALATSNQARNELLEILDGWATSRLDPSDYDPVPGRTHSMHPVKRAFASAAWHQALGRMTGSDPERPLVNMHTVMGEIHAMASELPKLIEEAGDEIGLTPTQVQQLADKVAEKVERVTVVVESPEAN